MTDENNNAAETSAPAAETPTVTKKTLQEAVKDLYFSSESDEPVKAVALTPKQFGAETVNTETVAAYRKTAPESVKSLPVAEFFAPMTAAQDWWGDEEKAVAAAFTALVQLLTTGLTNAAAYRLGDGPEIEVLVLGTTDAGEILGVRTQLTET
jgi:histidine triad (HIT) family protein